MTTRSSARLEPGDIILIRRLWDEVSDSVEWGDESKVLEALQIDVGRDPPVYAVVDRASESEPDTFWEVTLLRADGDERNDLCTTVQRYHDAFEILPYQQVPDWVWAKLAERRLTDG